MLVKEDDDNILMPLLVNIMICLYVLDIPSRCRRLLLRIQTEHNLMELLKLYDGQLETYWRQNAWNMRTLTILQTLSAVPKER